MGYTYTTGTNHLSNVTNTGAPVRYLGYDVNGNLISDSEKGITQTGYTRSHFPEKMTVNGKKITYLYDANDSRMYKNVDTTLEEYYLKDLGVLDMKTGNWSYYLSGTERHLRIVPDSIHQPRLNATEPTIDFKNHELSFYETDHLGNTRVVFNPFLGDTIYAIEFAANYYPYGKILRQYVNTPEKYQLTGKQRDEETELDYFGARYYDSDITRFLGVDPLAAKFEGWTPYNFCLDNPMRYVDPTGNAPEDKITIGVDGIITKIERDDQENSFYDSKGNRIYFNDLHNVDKPKATEHFEVGDRLYFNVTNDEETKAYTGTKFNGLFWNVGVNNKWIGYLSTALDSHSSADFAQDFLSVKYPINRGGTDNDGIFRSNYPDNSGYFRFGNKGKIYNLYDAGNYMWGAWMALNLYSWGEIYFGSNVNEYVHLDGPDTDADQRAIRKGYESKTSR